MGTHILTGRKSHRRMGDDGEYYIALPGDELSPTESELKSFPEKFILKSGGETTSPDSEGEPTEGLDLSGMSVEDVKDAVRGGELDPELALIAERSSETPRKSLVAYLEKNLGG